MFRSVLAAAIAAALAAVPLRIRADEPGRDPCTEDVERLCPDVQLGSNRVLACLREHEAKLSGACRDKREADARKAKAVIQQFGRACRADMAEFCSEVPLGGGRVLECLTSHFRDLSYPCQSEMDRIAEARRQVETVRTACRADAARLCQGVPAEAGPLLACLERNQASLSAECTVAGARRAVEAAVLVDVLAEVNRQEKVQEALEILQGVDAIAFSRSQVLIQLDSYQAIQDRANGFRLLFNPQFVFGSRDQFALQVKVPVTLLTPYTTAVPAQTGLGDVTVGLGWLLPVSGRLRHYLSLGVQCETAAQPMLGAPWAIQPAYAVAMGLARWVSITTQVVWIRSIGSTGGYLQVDTLILEPIVVFNLPGRSFMALDTKLAWNLAQGGFAPVMKGVAGLFVDRQKSVSISAWFQGALTASAVDQYFQFGVGAGLAYFFDF
jgi:hypothetical protein